MDAAKLRAEFAASAPTLWAKTSQLVEEWTAPILDHISQKRGFPKAFNDPIWGTIELYPWETTLLDSPLIQRLRGIRQLGLAHCVYPGASHSRLEHSLGVVEASERMIQSLVRNAEHRRTYGEDPDEAIPHPSDLDKYSIRLAALLHDIGHGPFSHVTEPVIEQRYAADFEGAKQLLRERFAGVSKIAPSEVLAVLMVMSPALQRIFEDARFGIRCTPLFELAPAVTAHILGSRSNLSATYLSGVVSGPLDADKLDYMARDSYHTGLPIGLSINRLISKLEVVTITPENAPNPELKKRAFDAPNHRFYEMGISLSGLGAYEQMVIGRVILYDRIYYHHKVRSAESMVRTLIAVAQEERKAAADFGEFFTRTSDDSFIAILGGELKSDYLPSGKSRSRAISDALLSRRMYHRAYAFAARFIDGMDGLSKEEKRDSLQLLWTNVLDVLNDSEGCDQLARDIFNKARDLGAIIGDLKQTAEQLSPEHVIVDLPVNKTVVWRGDIPTRTESGFIGHPNLYFDPERWSQAYEEHKQGGFVFAPKEFVPLIALASQIVFYDRFQVTMSGAARHVSKTVSAVDLGWIRIAADQGLCSAECLAALTENRPKLVPVLQADIRVPDEWTKYDPGFAGRIASSFQEALPIGLPASIHAAVLDAIDDAATFLDMAEKGGLFVNTEHLDERTLQARMRDHLRSRGVEVREGSEIGGGETDLILPGPLVMENKVRGDTADPLGSGTKYPWQARRYSIAISSRVSLLLVGYKPRDERAILPLPQRLAIVVPEGAPEASAQIKIIQPYGHPVPSRAPVPKR